MFFFFKIHMYCGSCSVRNELDFWRVISKADGFPMHFTQQARGHLLFLLWYG